MKRIDDIIDEIILAEGGYSDNPDDSGGKTMYGITEKVARANGYGGDMRDLPIGFARTIYYQRYVVEPGFDRILLVSYPICAEMVDTGVNMGPATAAKFLQQTLNAFNQRGSLWPDLVVDGGIGRKTMEALAAYLKHRRGDDGERVLLVALNCLQGARYIELAQADQKNETHAYGWLRNRVAAHV